MIKQCPECQAEIKEMPVRKALEPGTGTFPMVTTYTGAVSFGPDYGPTEKTYKCSNPGCWVTKITESWE